MSAAVAPATTDQLAGDAYHADTTRISASGLKLLARSPAHYWAKYLDPEREPQAETDALRLGKALHCVMLEPSKFGDLYVRLDPALDMRTKAAKEFRDGLIAAGRQPLKADEFDLVCRIADRVTGRPSWRMWFSGGQPEYTITWTDAETGAPCKMRADYLLTPEQGELVGLPFGLISDLKSTTDALAFQRQAWSLGYHIQAAFYRRGYCAHFGVIEPPPFVFGAYEKESPFAGVPYPVSDRLAAIGDREVSRLLRRYVECLERDEWPAYGDDLIWLEPPAWAKTND